MSIQPGTFKVGSTSSIGREKMGRARYSFAIDGGAVGDITLRGDTIPNGAIVTDCFIDRVTAMTSAGAATVALKINAAADVNAADAFNAGTWASTGVVRADALTATTTPIKTTAARSVVATVGTAALTAGAFDVIFSYVELA